MYKLKNAMCDEDVKVDFGTAQGTFTTLKLCIALKVKFGYGKEVFEEIMQSPNPNAQQPQANPYAQQPQANLQRPQNVISRRRALLGLTTLGVVAAGGGFVWWNSRPGPGSPSLLPAILPPPPYIHTGPAGSVWQVAWSPDSKRIAEICVGNNGSWKTVVQIWDADNGGHVSFEVTRQNTSGKNVSWSPDGKRIVTNLDGKVEVWDVDSGKIVYTCSETANVISIVAWSPDGKRIASANSTGTVQIWDANNGDAIYTHPPQGNFLTLSWSPDGKRIASGDDSGTVQVWNADNGSNLYTYKGHSGLQNTVAWSPDGKRIALGSFDTVQIWDADNGGNVSTYTINGNAMAWSPDGKRIASSSGLDTVQVWDAHNGSHLYTYKGHPDSVQTIAWSPDGKRIASGGLNGTVQVWQPPS